MTTGTFASIIKPFVEPATNVSELSLWLIYILDIDDKDLQVIRSFALLLKSLINLTIFSTEKISYDD